jgi:TRAP-type C4-dicarboxylate transport system permease small subunit
MNFIEKLALDLSRLLFGIAGTAIVLMMVLTFADVVLRLLRHPIPGTYELVCYLGSASVAFAIAHTTLQKGHIAVSILVQLLPRRAQAFVETATNACSLALFYFISMQSFRYAGSMKASGEVSLTLQLPFYPFIYGVSFSAATVCLVLFVDLLKNLGEVFGK